MAEEDQSSIPFARFQEVVGQKNKAEADLLAAQKQITTLEGNLTSQVATITQERDALVKTLETTRLDHDVDRALLQEGVNADGIDYLRYRYANVTVEEGQEKPGFGDWFTEYKGANAGTVAAFRIKPKDDTGDETVETKAEEVYPWKRPAAPAPKDVGVGGNSQRTKPTVKTTYSAAELSSMSPTDARGAMEAMGIVKPRPEAKS